MTYTSCCEVVIGAADTRVEEGLERAHRHLPDRLADITSQLVRAMPCRHITSYLNSLAARTWNDFKIALIILFFDPLKKR